MNTKNSPAVNMENLKAFAKNTEVRQCAKGLAAAMVNAKATRTKVNAYIAPVFARFTFNDVDGNRITDAERLWLCKDDAKCARFYEACDEAHREAGYTLPPGYCPALVAENEVVQLEVKLLKLASAAFGVNFHEQYGEKRLKALDLFLGVLKLR